MIKKELLSDELKKAMEKFNQGFKDIKPMIDILDSIVKYFEIVDKQLTPVYEKFKKISDIFDKVDLIDTTMLRINKYHTAHQKSSKDSYFSLFQ